MKLEKPELCRPTVVLALGLLLLNDHVLKAQYPGWITGKLSDVAGLFVLGAFLAWLVPRRTSVLLPAIALAFAVWKSELATPLITVWNQIGLLPVARVVDLTDLWALPFLFLGASRWRAPAVQIRFRSRGGDLAVAAVSLLAFAATSKLYDFKLQDYGVSRTVVVDGSILDLETHLEPCDIDLSRETGGSGSFGVYVTPEPWSDGVQLVGKIREDPTRTLMIFEEALTGREPDDVAAFIDKAVATLRVCLERPEAAVPPAEARDASHLLGELEGTFVVSSGGETFVHNPERAETLFKPASTFKIPNMMIAVETGIATGTDFLIPWDGERPEQGFWAESWSRDHTLGTAMQNGVLWYFQEIARRIGHERMAAYVSWFDYGNRDVSGPIDRFWLDGPLEISAREQVEFLRRFQERRLNLDWRTIGIAREVLKLEETGRYVLSGKTGSILLPSGQLLAWLVGWVEVGEEVHLFALNLECPDFETCDFEMRRRLVVEILDDWGILLPAKTSEVLVE